MKCFFTQKLLLNHSNKTSSLQIKKRERTCLNVPDGNKAIVYKSITAHLIVGDSAVGQFNLLRRISGHIERVGCTIIISTKCGEELITQEDGMLHHTPITMIIIVLILKQVDR